ncbi:glycosyl hydrolase [Flagellimonas iocasae]|uniref:Glycosyl hydrolase n=1 Tax=Flagellimonas iocasae TaxID=2055905 RepID=A0ABW4XW06_9FLAO
MKNALLLALVLLTLSACNDAAEQPNYDIAELRSNFQNPPNEAKPRVWWHWMNGNVTKEGIQKDLEWMERTGIGGFHNFDAGLSTPEVVEKKLVFMTPDWKDAFKFTTDLAIEKGMEMTIAGSPGWSETGGPWVAPEDGMKKYVWTETRVQGGKTFEGELPQPANTIGKFQDIPTESGGVMGGFMGERPTYYEDAQVFAYKVPEGEKRLTELNPNVSSSGGNFNLTELVDGNLHQSNYLPPLKVGEEAWLQYEFNAPQTFKALSIVGASTSALGEFQGNPNNRTLQVSNDGILFKDVVEIPGSTVPQSTISFVPTTGKYWRMAWQTLPPSINPFMAMIGLSAPTEPAGVEVAEFKLFTTDRIDQFEDKAGFSPWREDTPTYLPENAASIPSENVVDLTQKMDDSGSLTWQIPDGEWVIVRMGYSLTGRQNHPASPEATGLEVDKLDEDAVRKYINHYLDLYKDATGGQIGETGLRSIILDSYEAGHMTWTHDFPEEFMKRRGYSMLKWLPVLTGRIVNSVDESEKFLWDFRKTIGEMIVENHYEVIGEELHKRGMKRYTESHEGRRIFLADGMDVKRNSDIPMSAMWTPGSFGGGTDEEVRSEADIRESASVAHLYGQPFVAAESMTSIGKSFVHTPEKLKRTADLEMASGLNRFVIHTSVHQPLDDKMPGFSLGPFGQYFTRQETWAEQAHAWITYLARSCYLLQQGNATADALVYYGENANLTWEFNEELPRIPGYSYDFVNASALQNALSVKDGKLVSQGGTEYGLLVLHESAKNMTLPTLKRLNELVQAGAKVTGTKPERSPSLADDPNEFKTLVEQIWSHENVFEEYPEAVLTKLGIAPDMQVLESQADVLFVHRNVGGLDIYWVDSRSDNNNYAELSFRSSGKAPKIWHPQTGEIHDISWSIKDGRTIIPVDFAPWEAFFVVFEEDTDETEHIVPNTTETEIQTIAGPWEVTFQEDRGAPASATFETLGSWTVNKDDGIKFFSGTATYTNTVTMDEVPTSGKVILDLGEVKDVAEVTVNDKNLGVLWKTPFTTDITDVIKTGENTLKINVTNVWANRLIRDAQPEVQEKITYTTMPFYQGNEPLLPSGLLGEVKILLQN